MHSTFRKYYKEPSEGSYNDWEFELDRFINFFHWDFRCNDTPELISSSKVAVNAFRRFLTAWAWLQIEVREAKICLKNIFENVFAPLYNEEIMDLLRI